MISCVVLTKNEEENIVDCLESVSFCDEIIVVDDYSDDRTISVINNINFINKKTKIYQRHLDGDFAKQRNFGLEKTKGEWILFVDADERVTPELREEILEQVRNSPSTGSGPSAFSLRRKDFLFGRWLEHGETGNIKLLRLVRKDKGKWERRVHEELRVRQLADGKLGTLEGSLLHYPHQTVSEFLKEINFYTDLNVKEFYKNGIRVPPWAIILYPLAKFVKNYFLKLGFLDGMAGYLQASIMSFHSFMTRAKLWQMYRHSGLSRI